MLEDLSIALVDDCAERRASITHRHSQGPVSIVPFEAAKDLPLRHESGRVYLAHDQDRSITAIFEHFNSHGIWAPVIAYGVNPRPTQVAGVILEGALDYLAFPFTNDDLRGSLAVVETRSMSLRDRAERAARARANIVRLSNRELEVISAVGDGLSNKRIALRLGLSPRTVENHRNNAIVKLGVNSSVEAVRMVLETHRPGNQ